MTLRYVIIALLIDVMLIACGVAWLGYLGPAMRISRLADKTDQQHPAFMPYEGHLPTLSNTYLVARYSLRGADGWEIVGHVPNSARYFSIALYAVDGRPPDASRSQRATLYDEEIVYDDPAERSFRILVSGHDRGYLNWLDCSQMMDGLIMIRENGVTPEQVAVPQIRVVHRPEASAPAAQRWPAAETAPGAGRRLDN